MTTPTEYAWCAGFWDGEGCTTRATRGPGLAVRPRLTISQKERAPLVRFQAAMEGRGAIQPHGQRDILHWQCNALADVEFVLNAMWPFLSAPKKDQAERVLAESRASKAQEFSRRSRAGREREAARRRRRSGAVLPPDGAYIS